METLRKINLYAAFPLVGLVWVYQKTFSPDHGLAKAFYPNGYCKFYPSCSEYARLALTQGGLITLPKIFKRVVSCNPLSTGGIDLPRI